MTRLIGLTGGIGSGKSTVAELLVGLGAALIDGDRIVRDVQAAGAPLLDEIASVFGAEILGPDGALDRKALGALVFRDARSRARLNAIVHPAAIGEMLRRLGDALARRDPVVVLDIPLLYEGRASGAGSAALLRFHSTVLVYVPEAVQVARQIERDGCDEDEALRRIRAQMPIEEKRSLADHVVDNTGSRERTAAQVRALWPILSAAS